jgi:hypothetical protein
MKIRSSVRLTALALAGLLSADAFLAPRHPVMPSRCVVMLILIFVNISFSLAVDTLFL